MRLHRFIGTFDLSAEQLIVDDAELSSQLSKVLRLKSGDEVILCDGNGFEARAEIRSIRATSASFKLGKKERVVSEPESSVTLYCSILKRENFDLVVQKATEVGVKKIVPLICERTVKQELKADRLAKIAKEAAEQSGRGVVPVIGAPLSLSDAFTEGAKYGELFLFDPTGAPLSSATSTARTVALFVGPEGGWSDAELGLAKQSGMQIVSLGALTLRAETAAIIASFFAVR